MPTAASVRLCPRGAPLTHGGATGTVADVARLPIAGCMLMADAQYEPSADVHVPQMCAMPAAYLPGCLFPGALNYNPGAKQSGFCHYETSGCTRSTAVNYNAHATHDDGSCIEGVPGCTIKPTRNYDPASGGMLVAAGGAGGAAGAEAGSGGSGGVGDEDVETPVLNYISTATVMAGCIVRVEGCMDAAAANYDPHATVNTRTW